MSAPLYTYDQDNGHVFSLVRGGETKVYKFGEHSVSVHGCKKAEFKAWELARMWDASSAMLETQDGFVYYFVARPLDVGSPILVWLASKEEAETLRAAILEAEEAERA